jgi:hypothetical protein
VRKAGPQPGAARVHRRCASSGSSSTTRVMPSPETQSTSRPQFEIVGALTLEGRASLADLDRAVSLAHFNHLGWQLGTPLLDDRALCLPTRVVQQHDASRRESILHDRCQTIATTAGRALRAIAHNQADPVGQVRRPRARTRDVVAQLHEMRSRRALGQWPRRLPRTLGSPGACSARGANRLATPRSLRPRPPL